MITRLFLRQLEKVLIFRHTFSSLTVTNTNSNMMKVNEISDHSKTSQKIGVDHLLLLNPISHFVTNLGFRKVIIWMILSLEFLLCCLELKNFASSIIIVKKSISDDSQSRRFLMHLREFEFL